MKVVGIIAEYNPFHNGHAYQIRYAKEILKADYIVVAMSGDFVQRGAPALLGKHTRAEMALLGGADLVLELPVSTATASAEAFAQGGVSLLDGLGIVDELCFGCECGDTSVLMKIAEILVKEPPFYREILQDNLRRGMTFPAARSNALEAYLIRVSASGQGFIQDSRQILSSPNNILGIEYCKAILRLKSSIKPAALLRKGQGYHDAEIIKDSFPSASAIRSLLKDPQDPGTHTVLSSLIPPESLPPFTDSLKKNAMVFESHFDLLLHYKLLTETSDSLSRYEILSDALIRRILKFRNQYQGFSQFADLLKTRDITRTAVNRGLLHILLGLTEKAPGQIPYARVLGFRKSSSSLMGTVKKQGRIPLITKPADGEKFLSANDYDLFLETCNASNIYQAVSAAQSGLPFVHEMEKQIRITLT